MAIETGTLSSRADSIQAVLNQHAHADLAARYVPGMEVFVQVDGQLGTPAIRHGKPQSTSFDDGATTFYSFRVVEWKDSQKPLGFALGTYWSSIGISGWDQPNSTSHGVGFDFDAIMGHAEGVGLTQQRLAEIRRKVEQLDYVEIRQSTSGKGLHLWVMFDPGDLPRTTSRAEHKALGRAVLQRMAHDSGLALATDVDHLADILWICAKRATQENDGLALVQAAKRPLTDWPRNFLEHLDVVRRKSPRTQIAGMSGKASAGFAAVCKDRPRIELDSEHREFERVYATSGFAGQWNEDHYCFIGHSCGVAATFNKLKMKGFYETNSPGTDPSTPNLWMFPLENGGWRVYRYGLGTSEARTWHTTQSGWTSCFLNTVPTLEQVAQLHGGLKLPRSKHPAYVFPTIATAIQAVGAFDVDLDAPTWLTDEAPRGFTLSTLDGGGLEVEFTYKSGDDESVATQHGWIRQRGPVWRKALDAEVGSKTTDLAAIADEAVRHLARNGEQEGLYVNSTAGWQKNDLSQVKAFLTHRDHPPGTQQHLLGWCADHPWKHVAKPFAGEYPGDREWNRGGAVLAFEPAATPEETPHWDLVLEHIGRGLDIVVADDPWCDHHGIITGADYLRRWIANLIRLPARRLPMLALYSPENNTGKSTLHEAIRLLFDERAFVFADGALTNDSGFNGELHGKALCVVEETDISASVLAYSRLKQYITNHQLPITYKGKDLITVENYTHWIMTTNDRKRIPIESGDTRIVVIEVTPYDGREVAKPELMKALEKEASSFVRQLLDLDLADIDGRHTLPVLTTPEKVDAMVAVAKPKGSDDLDPLSKAAASAIESLPMPWTGTASDLCSALGDWDRNLPRRSKNRAMSLGRYMGRLKPHLKERGIDLQTQKSKVTIYCLGREPLNCVNDAVDALTCTAEQRIVDHELLAAACGT
jgi:hypothetical protein